MSAVAVCSDCGWRGTPTTRAHAGHAARRHVCSSHRTRVERAARVQARRESSGPVRDCAHPRAQHVHGTKAAYVADRCRCRACRDAVAAYERRRVRESVYGRWQPYVDAQPVREHVQRLSGQGMGHKRVAHAAGVPVSVIGKLLWGQASRGMGPSKRLRSATAQRILAVEPDLADRVSVPARPTWRHVESLVALGYSRAWIAAQIGQQGRALQIGREQVWRSTADAIAALVDRVADMPGPCARARNEAAAKGWLPPAYGTDEEVAEMRAAQAEHRSRRGPGRLSIEEVHDLLDVGVSLPEIARRSGVTLEAVQRRLARHGLKVAS